MADPQRRTQEARSAVASCSVTECKFNENRNCHAGEIEVRMERGGAMCATYQPEEPKARP